MTRLDRIKKIEIAKVAALSSVELPGRLQVVLRDDRAKGYRVVRDLRLGEPLLANTLVAALLTPGELRAHLYIAHKASEGELVTVLGYVKTEALGGRAGAELRVPQDGAWLLCPTRGMVFIVTSDEPLTRRALSGLLHGRVSSSPPVGAATASYPASGTASSGRSLDGAAPPLGGDDDLLIVP